MKLTYEGSHEKVRLPVAVDGPDGEPTTVVARGETVDVPKSIADGLNPAAGWKRESSSSSSKPTKTTKAADKAGKDDDR